MSKVQINVEGVNITLTAEQLAAIDRQLKSNKLVTERIKTFEDACEELGVSPTEDRFINGSKHANAFEKLIVIAVALNEGWKPNWGNSTESKYYPYFKMSPFVCYDWDFGDGISGVGARLCYKSSELATYAGTQFSNLYQDYLT